MQPVDNNIFIGIDISKQKFDVVVLRDNKLKHKSFSNVKAGFQEFLKWLKFQKVDSAHACMESTNIYGEALAEYLFDKGFLVSIVNPARIKGFALSELARTKTDKSDAARIARFCAAMNPAPWTPDPLEIRQLRAGAPPGLFDRNASAGGQSSPRGSGYRDRPSGRTHCIPGSANPRNQK